ncbi:MAG: lytic transglycosylase domain-containing protein [Caulobacterales bacterium]
MKDGGWIRAASLAVVSGLLLVASSGSMSPTVAAAQEAQQVSLARPAMPSASEMMRLRGGVAASDSGDWPALAMYRDSTRDPLVRRILQWRYAAAQDAPLEFGAISEALDTLQGWPSRGAMTARAEKAIFTSPLSARDRIAWFDAHGGPQTGDGRIAYAIAKKTVGEREEANRLARAAYRTDELSEIGESEAIANFSSVFSQDDYAARVDALLWRGSRTDARALLPRVSSADRALANARVALQTSQRRGLQAAVDSVPSSRAGDPGLLYDRTRYIRRSGRPEDAMVIAARINGAAAPAAARADIFQEKRLYVPRALRTGQRTLAYQLVSNHGLTSGESFADSEWLAGWIALRFQNNPQRAAEHFAHLSENVSSAVSKSRALYWQAEAARAMGQSDQAQARFREAAQYSYTYYGQLAASKSGGGAISLPMTPVVYTEARARFQNPEHVRAFRAVSEAGDRDDYEAIAYHLDDTLDDPQEIEALAQMSRERAYARTALRNAKSGLFRGVVAGYSAYPVLDLPEGARTGRSAEPAFVHAIIRQESEFDAGVVSSASARGLMQLMPATARLQAQREGMEFRGTAALINDPDYNVTLGARHLGDLVDQFGGSYVLAIVAYNAGPNRAREWIADWGDPRSPNVDVVDWVEQIPFAETRNYVQRVMENLQVYRHRLSGRPESITIEQDLRRGRY